MSAFEHYAKVKLQARDKNLKKKKKLKRTETVNGSGLTRPKRIGQRIVLNNIYNENLNNSTLTGQKLLEWLIHPVSLEDFMK